MIQNLIMLDETPNGAMNLIMIVALIAIFYLFMIRPQQKKQKEIRKFREGIKEGDRVVSAGGIYGKVKTIKEGVISLQIAPNVIIQVDINSVYPSAVDIGQDQQSNNGGPTK